MHIESTKLSYPKGIPAVLQTQVHHRPVPPITTSKGLQRETRTPHVSIVVTGATGSGKTSLINLCSGSILRVGKGLESCTSEVQTAWPFEIDGKMVTLIDTPGYDDTGMSDTEILKMIAIYLADLYERKENIVGVIYVHRISDFKMGGTSTRNLNMFRHLCGESALVNVAIVTNMWGQVSKETGEAREAELAHKDKFFRPFLERSARILRHDNTFASAQAIVRSLIHNSPRPLRIQQELADESKDVSQTAAGKELNHALTEQARRNLEELEMTQKELERAIEEKDEETRKELEAEQQKLTMEIFRVQSESQSLAIGFHRHGAASESGAETARALEGAKKESARIMAAREKELRELQLQVELNDSVAALEENTISKQWAETHQASTAQRPQDHKAVRSVLAPGYHLGHQVSYDTFRSPILPSPQNADIRDLLSVVKRRYEDPPPGHSSPGLLTMISNYFVQRYGRRSDYDYENYYTSHPYYGQ